MTIRTAATVAVAALIAPMAIAATTTPATASQAAVTIKIRPGDLVASLSGTGSAGHADFRVEGVALSSDSSGPQGAVAEYFPVGKRLAVIGAVNYASYGTITQRYVLDADGDGDVDGELVGVTDGGTNLYATDDSSQAMLDAAPSSGQTVAEWKSDFPDAVVKFGGFASDPVAAGDETLVVRLSYGTDAYKFTSTPEKVKTDVTGYSRAKRTLRHTRIDLYSITRPDNVIRDKKLQWVIRVDRKTVFSVAQGFDNHDYWAQSFRKHTGKHLVRLFKNGSMVRSYYVFTR
ncbi:hypothetical protein [Nocardioides sp.]|uniref:hypothetical protein n=1 Tax=Nocardioides sp. TaxID=35761 RepID=UPI003D1314CA